MRMEAGSERAAAAQVGAVRVLRPPRPTGPCRAVPSRARRAEPSAVMRAGPGPPRPPSQSCRVGSGGAQGPPRRLCPAGSASL